MSIVVPYLPVVVGLAVANVLEKPAPEPWDYDAIHSQDSPLPWSIIGLVHSTEINWGSMNNCYINFLTAIPVFLFFGTTKDAVNEYRAAALFLGLGRLFPRLRTEYDPDRTPCHSSSYHSRQTATSSKWPFCRHDSEPANLSLELSLVNGQVSFFRVLPPPRQSPARPGQRLSRLLCPRHRPRNACRPRAWADGRAAVAALKLGRGPPTQHGGGPQPFPLPYQTRLPDSTQVVCPGPRRAGSQSCPEGDVPLRPLEAAVPCRDATTLLIARHLAPSLPGQAMRPVWSTH